MVDRKPAAITTRNVAEPLANSASFIDLLRCCV
jgi:hypothetical protein